MKHAALSSLVLAAAISLAACDSIAGPQSLPLTVQAAVAPADGQEQGWAVLSYQITNNGSSELFLQSCDHRVLVAVERQQNGSWVNASAGICPTHLDMVPISIAPGATRQGTRAYPGGPGRYRVVAYGHRSWDDPHRVTLVSNVVDVE